MFGWHEVYGASSQASIDFYSQVFEWEVQKAEMEGGDYNMLLADGVPIAGVVGTSESPMWGEITPHWAVYITVDSVDQSAAKCKSLGGKILVEAMDVSGVGRMALAQDPQGASFWLFETEPKAEGNERTA